MLKTFTFIYKNTDGKTKMYTTSSKHLNGAVRKLYQEVTDIDTLVKICG